MVNDVISTDDISEGGLKEQEILRCSEALTWEEYTRRMDISPILIMHEARGATECSLRKSQR